MTPEQEKALAAADYNAACFNLERAVNKYTGKDPKLPPTWPNFITWLMTCYLHVLPNERGNFTALDLAKGIFNTYDTTLATRASTANQVATLLAYALHLYNLGEITTGKLHKAAAMMLTTGHPNHISLAQYRQENKDLLPPWPRDKEIK